MLGSLVLSCRSRIGRRHFREGELGELFLDLGRRCAPRGAPTEPGVPPNAWWVGSRFVDAVNAPVYKAETKIVGALYDGGPLALGEPARSGQDARGRGGRTQIGGG